MQINQNVFLDKKREFMCRVVLAKGMKVGPKKIMEIIEWPSPKMITSLRGFLGMIGHYKRFVKNYVDIMAPLTTLFKKHTFRWNNEVEDYFKNMNTLMTSTPILETLNFTNPNVLKCDACRT